MSQPDRQAHWDRVYTTKGENGVSWFLDVPVASLDLIAAVGADSAIIDIGGGASKFPLKFVHHLPRNRFPLFGIRR